MTREEILNRIKTVEANLDTNFGPQIKAVLLAVLEEKIPEYSFALREDIKDNKEFLPTKAEPKATGWDVRAAMEDRKPLVVRPFQHIKIPLGFRSFCPDGWWWELKPRSSTFAKKNLHALYGTIDETYEGQAIFACQYIPNSPKYQIELNPDRMDGDLIIKYITHPITIISPDLTINFGDAIGQIIPIRRQEMKVVERTNEEYDNACKNRAGQRGAGGFGSTG